MYESVIKEFNDIIQSDDVFNSFTFQKAIHSLKNSTSFLKFLIGVPGSGKSFFVKYYNNKIDKNSVILQGNISLQQLNNILSQNYSLIIIDEAQLLDIAIIEKIRILSDEKKAKFLLSMHLKEATQILKKEHFKSRTIDIIKLDKLSKDEMIQYLNTKLISHQFTHIITKKEFEKIYNYTKGNFRYIKKFVKTLFELLEIAHQHQLKKYQKINNCLLTMCAIELGLTND